MELGRLLAALPLRAVTGPGERRISGIAADSRQVGANFLFVAIPGFKTDGHLYIPEAMERGAVAIVTERECLLPDGICHIQVPDSRRALALLAAEYYGHPSRRLGLVGVTGTNGKTTTTHMTRAILAAAGYRTGLIGTVENIIGEQVAPAQRTTPDALDVQNMMGQMVETGVDWLCMEVSSHALALGRVEQCEFDVAVFTNLSRDHFDFHRDYDEYLSCKAGLFRGLGRTNYKSGPKVGVANVDDPAGCSFLEATAVHRISYGLNNPAMVTAAHLELGKYCSSFTLLTPLGSAPLTLPLPGLFNVYNALAAAAAATAIGILPSVIARALRDFSPVRGRCERLDTGLGFTVYIDFAHNPGALESLLQAVRATCSGRVILVFGAEGEKDRGKRPLMGQIAARWSDYSIITTDNVYHEDPLAILRAVEQGYRSTGRFDSYATTVNRRQAIREAIRCALPGDVVVIAGKGHEKYQVIGDDKIPFDDREEVFDALASLSALPEPARQPVLATTKKPRLVKDEAGFGWPAL